MLIFALMSPVSSHVQLPKTVNTLAICCGHDLPEPVRRVFNHLDGTIRPKEGAIIPREIPVVTVRNASCDPGIKGNILILEEISESDETDTCQFSYDVVSSSPDCEVVLLRYSSAATKSVQFPIIIAETVDHFRREGVFPVSFPIQKEYNLPLWLAAAAGIVILCALLFSTK